MNVVYCATRNYYHKLLPSIRSLREHHPDAVIYVVGEDDDTGIEGVISINAADQQYFPRSGVNYNNMFTYIALMKTVYQSLLPVDKVIHLDADTIVADSLEPLWKMKLADKWYAMVPEYKGKYKPFGDKYYNSGVFLANLKQLRKDGIQEKMVEYLNTVKQPWGEQDAFNKYGIEQDKIVDLDIRFNENMMTGQTDNPAVVHYCAIPDWYGKRNMSRACLGLFFI